MRLRRRWLRWMRGRAALRVAGIAFGLLLLLPAAGCATASWSVISAPALLPWPQLWPVVIGSLVPLVTYGLNRAAPWISQPVKAVVLVVVSAIATALYTALATNVLGFNDATLQLVLTGVVASLAAHHMLWKPSGISTLLGAYADYGLPSRGGKLGPPPSAPVLPPHVGTNLTRTDHPDRGGPTPHPPAGTAPPGGSALAP